MEETNSTKQVWITTLDNPFDPFTQFDRWFNFDQQKGYRTCERVARLAHCNPDNLTQKENQELVNQAIVTLCETFGADVYRPVVEGQTQAW